MTFCRMVLPLPVGAGAHGGTWHAVLTVDERALKREITRLTREVERGTTRAVELERILAHGVRYWVTVSSWSNLRMSARVTQSDFKPGATLRLSALLTEYGLPGGEARPCQRGGAAAGRRDADGSARRRVPRRVRRRAHRRTRRRLAHSRPRRRAGRIAAARSRVSSC